MSQHPAGWAPPHMRHLQVAHPTPAEDHDSDQAQDETDGTTETKTPFDMRSVKSAMTSMTSPTGIIAKVVKQTEGLGSREMFIEQARLIAERLFDAAARRKAREAQKKAEILDPETEESDEDEGHDDEDDDVESIFENTDIITPQSMVLVRPVVDEEEERESSYVFSGYSDTSSDSDDEPRYVSHGRLRTGDAADWTKNTKAGNAAYSCPRADCSGAFPTRKELRSHRMREHDYCDLCDLDFPSYFDLVKHKTQSRKHISCPVCGFDFATTGARDFHMNHAHPDKRDLACPGCGTKFNSGSALVGHLEGAKCTVVTREQFKKARAMAAESANLLVDKENLKAKGILPVSSRQEQPRRTLIDPEDEEAMPKVHDTESKGKAILRQGSEPTVTTEMQSMERSQREREIIRLQNLMINVARMDDESNRILVYRPDGTVWEQVDPRSSLYNPALLRQGRHYVCPHLYCTKFFKSAAAITAHLKSPTHTKAGLTCPECHGEFKSAAALIGHLESPNTKCFAKFSDIYKEAVDIASGGFLKVGIELGDEDQVPFIEAGEPTWDAGRV